MRILDRRRPRAILALALGAALLMVLPPATGYDRGAGLAAHVCASSGASVQSSMLDREIRRADDPTIRRDACRQPFFAEAPPLLGPPLENADSGMRRPAPLAATFKLDSLPGSARTIYLDFTGVVLTGTGFNDSHGLPSIVVPPFSMTSPADTRFTNRELTAIQRAWQVVTEDFAPFDVNVTTRVPTADQLTRTSVDDPTYGVTVVATPAGSVLQDACHCGGLAYPGVFGETGEVREYHQPGFAFGAMSDAGVGEAISHEVGHMFGLLHDGTQTSTYYDGSSPWAPIMGAGYHQPITQWSAGEYTDASNRQDDVGLIAQLAPLRTDDHGDTPQTATRLTFQRVQRGVISTREDVDAFTFTAGGPVTIRVRGRGAKADLDVGLRIMDAEGVTVATVGRPASGSAAAAALSLDAVWHGHLPKRPAAYTVIVDGVGTGFPEEPGLYSDYGSLGAYRVRLRAG